MRKKRCAFVVPLVKESELPTAVFVQSGVQSGAFKSSLESTAYFFPARVPHVSWKALPFCRLVVRFGPSRTSTVMISKSLNAGEPLSVTRTLMKFVPVPVGVKVNAPAPVIDAPAGGVASRLKVSTWAGKSLSLAVGVKDNVCPKYMTLLPIGSSTGAALDDCGRKFGSRGV